MVNELSQWKFLKMCPIMSHITIQTLNQKNNCRQTCAQKPRWYYREDSWYSGQKFVKMCPIMSHIIIQTLNQKNSCRQTCAQKSRWYYREDRHLYRFTCFSGHKEEDKNFQNLIVQTSFYWFLPSNQMIHVF